MKTRELGEICSVQGGYAYKSRDFCDEGIPVIKIGDVTGGGSISYDNMQKIPLSIASATTRFASETGDSLISMTGANVGKVSRVREGDPNARINQRVGRLIPKHGSGFKKDFIYYLISRREAYEYVSGAAYGSAQPNISSKLIESLPVPNFEPREANAIGNTLSSLDNKIELNRRMNATLERQAQAIFRDWFVDFGPVRRKMALRGAQGSKAAGGKAAGGNGADAQDAVAVMGGLIQNPEKATQIAALFPDTMGNEGLPLGWEEGTLSRIASTNSESWKASNHPDEVNYVDLSNTKWGVIESTEILPWAEAPSRARRVARAGDTIVGTVRPGNGSYSFISRDGYTVSTGFAVLRPSKPIYVAAVNIAATGQENIERLANLADSHGGAYPAVNADVVSASSFPAVDDDLLAMFAELADPMLAKIEQAKIENQTLAETRDYLLPRLMSGKVRVADAERLAE